MLDPNYINDQVLTDILENKGWPDDDDGYSNVSKLSVRDAFNIYLHQNGFIGYTDKLIEVYESLKHAEHKGPVGDANQEVYNFAK